MKISLLFFLILFFPLQLFAGVGDHDNRYYVTDEMWATDLYKKFVLLYKHDSNEAYCTAQYISKNLIISAGHCAGGTSYQVKNYKKDSFEVKLLVTPYKKGKNKIGDIGDWGVWIVTDPQYYSDSYFDIRVPNRTTEVINAGWGWMNILSDNELKLIRKALSERSIIQKIRPGSDVVSVDETREYIDRKLNDYYMECFHDFDRKLEECLKIKDSVSVDKCQDNARNEFDKCESSRNSQLKDSKSRLKASQCQILYNKTKGFPNMLPINCIVWGGNSGGGCVSVDGRYIYGTVSWGRDWFKGADNYITSAEQFSTQIKELIEYYNSHDYVPFEKIVDQIFNNPKYEYETYEQADEQQDGVLLMQELSQEIDELEQDLITEFEHVQNSSDGELLRFLNKMVEHQVKSEQLEKLEKAYRDARDKEQSTANKLLTAAAVAAGGLGGMEWAQGDAEQRADAAAEREMSAYIAMMKCEYGGGQQVDLGATETLPGGNEMFSYKTEFKQLAEKLKATKAALNLRPGIEAEVIYDRAETGLYDYQTAETGGDANPSLLRALMNPNGMDAAVWNAQKQESADKAQDGKTAAGIGVIGGAVGNVNTDVIKNVVEKIRK